MMWKGAKVAAAFFVLTACAEQREQAAHEALIDAEAQAAFIAQQDDASAVPA
jgi:hypothetical protein